ncbi:MAG TPA: hypothetical protein VJ508_19300 [Saprospiraceae bacterium]|nr:hypothetical protein [Saprospiraceae bacterium]
MKFLFTPLLLLLVFPVMGQIKALTDTGDQVVLYSDGTWKYVNRDTIKEAEIPTNPQEFKKTANADFLLKSTRIDVGVWLDPKSWTFNPRNDNEAAEYELDHVNGSLYGLLLTERLDLPLTTLGNIAVQNAREAAPDIEVTHKEFRMVNGQKILMMRMTGTIQDIRFSYYGYYFTANGGATQFLVYADEKFMEENLPMVEELLNGFVSLAP